MRNCDRRPFFATILFVWIVCYSSILGQVPLSTSIAGKYSFSKTEKIKTGASEINISKEQKSIIEYRQDGLFAVSGTVTFVIKLKKLIYSNTVNLVYKSYAEGKWTQEGAVISKTVSPEKTKFVFVSSSADKEDKVSEIMIEEMKEKLAPLTKNPANLTVKSNKTEIIKRSKTEVILKEPQNEETITYKIIP